MTNQVSESEAEYWKEIQKYRNCATCLYFDSKRVGKMGFCTYAGKLNIDETTRLCKSQKEK